NRDERNIYYKISLSAIELFLMKTPNLKHLHLTAICGKEFANGAYWSNFISSFLPQLSTFNFYFRFPYYISNEGNLCTFCSPFWLEYKQWYVAWDSLSQLLYILADRYFHHCNRSDYIKVTSTKGLALFCDTVTYLMGYWPSLSSSDKYSFFSWEPNYILNYATDRHLIFQRDIDWGRLVDYYSPNLSELTLRSLNKCKKFFPLYSIRKLEINEVEDIDQICSIFPSIEHLKIPVYDQNEIAYIINRLEYLCSAVFLYNGEKHISIKWICKKTNLIEANFTYRLDRQLCILYMWINNQSKVI
ncbi:unnamed protein product, partial [Rotaria sp. Silwood2]